MSEKEKFRVYYRTECISFRKTGEEFGGLSNMSPGYPVRVNGILIYTIEALYQACRYPHLPEAQKMIIGQRSPMTGKMIGKRYRKETRSDWEQIRVAAMRWCLRIKLAQHYQRFGKLLLSTNSFPIVENSRKDTFWGATPSDNETLAGQNILGRLLMELREEIKQENNLRIVPPPNISNFKLLDQSVEFIDFSLPPVPSSNSIFTQDDFDGFTSNSQ